MQEVLWVFDEIINGSGFSRLVVVKSVFMSCVLLNDELSL